LKSITDMDGIQLEISSYCTLSCSNCSRFCGLLKKPFHMSLELAKRAIDSTVGYNSFTGFIGGEPLLNPHFEEICRYARSKRDSKKLGLWTTLPKGFEHYAQTICDTFYHCYINDHSRGDIFHWPSLVGIQEVVPDKTKMWHAIEKCWVQASWCASINPKGAWFCEVAGAMAMLYDEGEGWPVEHEWWMRTPKDYIEQMEKWCPRCGMAAPLELRSSVENIDDISPLNYEALKDKVKNTKRFKIHDLSMVKEHKHKMAAYKDFDYRNRCARKYGMFLVINECNTWTPYMANSTTKSPPSRSIFEDYQERFGGSCATL
jgi:hypothetical protein